MTNALAYNTTVLLTAAYYLVLFADNVLWQKLLSVTNALAYNTEILLTALNY